MHALFIQCNEIRVHDISHMGATVAQFILCSVSSFKMCVLTFKYIFSQNVPISCKKACVPRIKEWRTCGGKLSQI